MHTPDGLITGWICVLMLLVSAAGLALAARGAGRLLRREDAWKYATVAAVIFAAQMLNFPVAGGTSGHLIGASLAAILFGPEIAVMIIASVLLVQAAVFGDGGMLAIGVNVFSMAIVGAYAAHFVYSRTGNAFLASGGGVLASALSCSLLLAAGGAAPVAAVLMAMVPTHALIGVGEGLITITLLAYFRSAAPLPSASYAAAGAGAAFFALAILLPFASGEPDGLESAALRLGFYENQVQVSAAPLEGYLLPGVEGAEELTAGGIGMLAVIALLVPAVKIAAFEHTGAPCRGN